MSLAEIKTTVLSLTSAERIELMNALWDSLGSEEIESPLWHEEELKRREKEISTGEAKLSRGRKREPTFSVALRDDRDSAAS